jgi:ribosomal protein S11
LILQGGFIRNEKKEKNKKLVHVRMDVLVHARVHVEKGLIHVQASFNNTIVTVTDVRGRVVYWASAGTCGFRGTRRGTPFAAQTAAGNAIRTVVEQGTQRAEVMKKGPGLGIPSSKVRSHGARRPFDDPTSDVIPLCSLPVEYPNYSLSNSGERFCLEMSIRNSQL